MFRKFWPVYGCLYIIPDKKETHTVKLINFSEKIRLHHFKGMMPTSRLHIVFFLEVKNLFKKIGFKPDGGQFVKSQKNCVFVMLSLRIKLSNVNRLYGPKCSQRVVLWDSSFISDRTQLSAVGVSLLCDYPIVVDYILKINLMKRKKI